MNSQYEKLLKVRNYKEDKLLKQIIKKSRNVFKSYYF